MFDNRLMASLYRNSLLKFVLLALRIYLVGSVLDLAASFTEITSIFSILQLSIIFTVTPGNLGVVEWGWVGLLPQVGVERLFSPVAGVEVCAREAEDGRKVVFVINHSGQMHSIIALPDFLPSAL